MQNLEIKPIFFPSKESEKNLIDFMDFGKQSIRICVYTFTNKNIVNKILEIVNNNKTIKVEVITDDVQTLIPSQRVILDRLCNEGNKQIQVKLDNSKFSLMHNKYLILDNEYLATGSFNWTNKAVTTNKENLLLIRNKSLAEQYTTNFEQLWEEFHFLGEEPKQIVKQPKKAKEPKGVRQKIIKSVILNKKAQTKKRQKAKENNINQKDQEISEDDFDEEDLDDFIVDDSEDISQS